MGRIIRRTVTITITESWTIVWTDEAQADDKLQATTNVQGQPKPQEEPDETILPAVTTGTATDAQPADMPPKSGAGRQRKRTCRRRATE